MFWMRADIIRSGTSNAAQRALLRRARPPYLFLKKASWAAPHPPTPSAARPEALEATNSGTPKRVDRSG